MFWLRRLTSNAIWAIASIESSVKVTSDALGFQQLNLLPRQRILRLAQDSHEIFLCQISASSTRIGNLP